MSTVTPCPWCLYNPYCNGDSNCDFRSLEKSKQAIIVRMKAEIHWISKHRRELLGTSDKERAHELFEGILDRTRALDIMVSVLKSEYKMSDDDIQPLFREAKMGNAEKLKMIIAMKKFQR